MHFSKREKKTLVTLTIHTLDKELRQNFFIFTLQNIKISLRNVRMSNMIVLTVLNSSLNSDFALVFNPWTQIMPGSPSDTFSNFNGMHLSQKNIYQISWITQVFNTSCLLFFYCLEQRNEEKSNLTYYQDFSCKLLLTLKNFKELRFTLDSWTKTNVRQQNLLDKEM